MHTEHRSYIHEHLWTIIYSGAAYFRESIRGWKSRIQGVQGKNYNFIHSSSTSELKCWEKVNFVFKYHE